MKKDQFKSIKGLKKNRPAKSKEPLPKTINVADLSEASQDVLEHFGIEAPALLNDYSNALEDALLEMVQKLIKLQQKYEALKSKYD